MPANKIILSIVALIALVVTGYVFINYKAKQAAIASISNFAECGKYFPVMETYPEQCRTSDGRLFVNNVVPPPVDTSTQDSRIHVSTPTPGARLQSPVSISGEARGTWYFEASFPIKLLDEKGKVVAQTHAQAEGDWMTENFVPFTAVLTFPATSTGSGTLVLENDNPSGLPEKAAEIRVPVSW